MNDIVLELKGSSVYTENGDLIADNITAAQYAQPEFLRQCQEQAKAIGDTFCIAEHIYLDSVSKGNGNYIVFAHRDDSDMTFKIPSATTPVMIFDILDRVAESGDVDAAIREADEEQYWALMDRKMFDAEYEASRY